jgi:hypothetical protein
MVTLAILGGFFPVFDSGQSVAIELFSACPLSYF